jgi:hypothetical protein
VTIAPDLLDGCQYTLRIRAKDYLGNEATLYEQPFKVDLTHPNIVVTGPEGVTSDTTPTFLFGVSDPDPAQGSASGVDDGSIICQLSPAVISVGACVPGIPVQLGELDAGTYTFTVSAKDNAGNSWSQPQSFTVVKQDMDVQITGADDGAGSFADGAVIASDSPQITYKATSGTDLTVVCTIDGTRVDQLVPPLPACAQG